MSHSKDIATTALPEHVKDSEKLLFRDDAIVAHQAFDWLMQGKVGLRDIQKKMTHELNDAEMSADIRSDTGRFYMKWQGLVQSMAQSMLEGDYYFTEKRATLFNYRYDGSPALSEHISQNHIMMPQYANHLSQDDMKFMHGAEQRVFHILTDPNIFASHGAALHQHMEIAAASIDPSHSHITGQNSDKEISH